MASQVQRWALFHSRPWRAPVCPIVHLGCLLRAVHQVGNSSWEEHILRLHWMVRAVVHIQQFINKRNVKYKPYSPWGHFPKVTIWDM